MNRLFRMRLLVPVIAVVVLAGCAGALNMKGYGGRRPTSYTVAPGDTLYSIAWHYGLDYHSVAIWNGIKPPYTIYPGQRICLYPSNGRGHVARSRPSRQSERPAPVVSGGGDHAAPPPPAAAGPVHWQWPGKGKVQSTFGGKGIAGKGIVINGRLGEPVDAAAGGTVVYSGSALVGYGRLIIIKHNDTWLSAYGHNQRLLVHEGEQVKAGQEIATMGIGSNEKPALYFEIRRDGKPVNPLHYLPKPG